MNTSLPAPWTFDIETALRKRLRQLRHEERAAVAEYVKAVLAGSSAERLRAIGERRRAARDEVEDVVLALSEIETRNVP
ncbi:MAG: hypothetical protein ACREM1_15505 [Longimicrobiales bacterium]